jgi:HAD superfamily hydrolase (TIGR01509 family)
MDVAALFWDNDGVLVDTEHLYFEATREVLATRGIKLTEDDYRELFLRSSRGILHFAQAHGWTDAELEALRSARSAHYGKLLRERARVIDGVEDVLAALHGRVAMGIVTSSLRRHFDIIHERTGLLKYFDFVLASGDYSEPKPHPAPYLKALERAGAAREACLVIEDSERGLASAAAAGLRCVMVPSRFTAGRAFPGAYRMLDSVRDILKLV